MTTIQTVLLFFICLISSGLLISQDKLEILNNAADGDARNIAIFKNEADGNRAVNIVNFEVGSGTNITQSRLETYHMLYSGAPNVNGFSGITNLSSGVFLRGTSPMSKLRFFIGGVNQGNIKMTVNNNGVGIGNDNPVSMLDLNGGTLFIRNTVQPVLQDTNGACWELTVSTSGALGTSTTTCP